MIVDISKLGRGELIKALGKAIKQISNLIDENKRLRDTLRKTTETAGK